MLLRKSRDVFKLIEDHYYFNWELNRFGYVANDFAFSRQRIFASKFNYCVIKLWNKTGTKRVAYLRDRARRNPCRIGEVFDGDK